MFTVSGLIDDYLVWALTDRGFDYSTCINSKVYEALDASIERVGEWIGGYTTACCTTFCYTECQLESIKQAIYRHCFAADQLKKRSDSNNLEEWELTAYRYLENRGLIYFGD